MRAWPVDVPSLCGAFAACGFMGAPQPARTPAASNAASSRLDSRGHARHSGRGDCAQYRTRKTETHIADIHNQAIDCAIAKCLLNLEAVRTGLITVAVADNKLTLTVPLSVNAQMPVKSSFFKATANGSASRNSNRSPPRFRLSPDWRVQSARPTGVDHALPGPAESRTAEAQHRRSVEPQCASVSSAPSVQPSLG